MISVVKKLLDLNLSNSLIGTLLLISTYLFFSIMELTAKELGQSFNPFQVVFARYSSQLILLLIIFNKKTSKHLKSEFPLLQVLRGALPVSYTHLTLPTILRV